MSSGTGTAATSAMPSSAATTASISFAAMFSPARRIHVLRASNDVDVTARIHARQIARAEPLPVESRGGHVRLAVIALQHARTAEQEPTHLPDRQARLSSAMRHSRHGTAIRTTLSRSSRPPPSARKRPAPISVIPKARGRRNRNAIRAVPGSPWGTVGADADDGVIMIDRLRRLLCRQRPGTGRSRCGIDEAIR